MAETRRHFLHTVLAGAASIASAQQTAEDRSRDVLLDEVAHRATNFFWDMADPETGLVLDRVSIDEPYAPGVASIAATGFGLSALCIGHARGYLPQQAAEARVLRTLEALTNDIEQKHGFFYHFLNSKTGKRVWSSELSSIDTTWLLCGVLHCRAYWDVPEILKLASGLLERADWRWMLNGSETLSHGWTPEGGFLPYRWDTYAELLAMYLLAIGSESKAIPASCWNSWKRPMSNYDGIFYIDASTPIFVHQYSHAWFDFDDRADKYMNYFRNSQRATQAHRQYCIRLSDKFPWFGPDMWGVSASESRSGYRIWGWPASPPDGTLVPCAAGGSMVFLPSLCGAVLERMRSLYGDKVWCKYGFVDAFHPHDNWYSRHVLGIDLGIMLLMAENARSGSVWDAVMSTPEAARAMKVAGFRTQTF